MRGLIGVGAGLGAVLAAASLWIAVAAGAAAAASTEEVEGLLRTSDRPEGRPIQVARLDGVDYLDLRDVALVARATKYWRAELGKMVLKVGERRVTLTVGSPYVQVDQAGTNLLAPVVWHRGRIFVPARLVTEVLDPLIPERVQWARDARELRVVRGDANVLGLHWDLRGGSTVVALRITEELAGEVAREGRRCVVRVPGARLAESMPARSKGIGLVDSVEVAADPAGARLTFWLDGAAGPAELVARPAPPRLELVVASPEAADVLPDAEFQEAVAVPAERPVRVIVLDAGHGGSDEGAKSEGGLAEKEVTLALAKRARDLLAADGFRVLLTRDRDTFVAPEARALVANREDADVFVSLHANAWFDPDLEGFGLGVSSAPAAPAADPLTPRPWGARDATAVRGSELLADLLSTQLAKETARPNRGVRAAAWAPLAGVSTAAVVVECGFLTNEGDAKRLGDPAFRDKVAAAVAGAVRAYRDAVAAALGAAALDAGDPLGEGAP